MFCTICYEVRLKNRKTFKGSFLRCFAFCVVTWAGDVNPKTYICCSISLIFLQYKVGDSKFYIFRPRDENEVIFQSLSKSPHDLVV